MSKKRKSKPSDECKSCATRTRRGFEGLCTHHSIRRTAAETAAERAKKKPEATQAEKEAALKAVSETHQAWSAAHKRLALSKKPASIKAAKKAHTEAEAAYRTAAQRRDEVFGQAVSVAPEPKAASTVTVTLSESELKTVLEGLDSYRYWQLSDENYRHDGFVLEPGSDDEENAKLISEVDDLESRLETMQRESFGKAAP